MKPIEHSLRTRRRDRGTLPDAFMARCNVNSLVSTQWLADSLGQPGLVVLDATKHLANADRDEHAEYLAGHIPGARFLDLGSLVDATSSVPAAMPRPEQLAQRLSELGVRPDDRIVVYDDSAVKTAARAWFLLTAHGIETVAILDGGFGKWKGEGRAIESAEANIKPTKATSLPGPKGVRFKADMLTNLVDMREQVLDARDSGRFAGTIQDTLHNLPSGHIPGSYNLPFGRLYDDDGTFKPPGQLRALFEEAGVDLDRPITTTCGSGITASVLFFALHLLDHPDLALYDGSWLDWGSDPDTPKITGDG